MITPALLDDLNRLAAAGCFKAPMLMLGAQESTLPGFPLARDWFRQHVGDGYRDLDLADGDLALDLNRDLREIAGRYMTVFNLGTVEHVWNVHAAWTNALRAVAPGGTFVTHSPVGGWQDAGGMFNHGLHMTRAAAIPEYMTLNGFLIDDAWTTRLGSRGLLFWAHGRKIRHIADMGDFRPVYRLRGLQAHYRAHP